MRGMTPVDVMREVRNVFPAARTEGTFVLSGGALSPDCALLPEDWVALCGSLRNDGIYQLDLFTDHEKLERERRIRAAMLDVRGKYGANAVFLGMNMMDGATALERNQQIGGHRK